jgi:S-adenosylmethionine synthetase
MDLALRSLPAGDLEREVEVVEHKGIGHPDTICDALAEAFGAALAKYYLKHFGKILHFNVDKALLSGGEARPAFHGGEVTSPIRVLLAGRATHEAGGVRIPVEEIALQSSKAWIRDHMHALDPERHIVWDCLAQGGSEDLVALFWTRGGHRAASWLANDTSAGAGYAPLSVLEQAVLAAGARLGELARERPEVGEDVKVMGVRHGTRIRLTTSCAFVGRHLADLADYAAARADVAREVRAAAEMAAGREVHVDVNAADDLSAGRIYLTVTGTSAEAGDDGEVGRGNRVNGLITPYRPMSLEAAAGKNPTSHVGKLYNVAAHRIANAIVERVPAVVEAHCFLVSRIGRPVEDPDVVDIAVRTRDGVPLDAVRKQVSDLVEDGLEALGPLVQDILAGGVRLY